MAWFAPICTKIEFVSLGGSFKGRIALDMVEGGEADGHLKPGGAIIETTSGNIWTGLARVLGGRGYRCIFIMPDKMSMGRVRLLKAQAAEVVWAPVGNGDAVVLCGKEIIDIVIRIDLVNFWDDPFRSDSNEVEPAAQQVGS